MLGWCMSMNSDIAMLFRREGFFAQMMLSYDIKHVTNNADAEPSEQQRGIVDKIGMDI